MNQIGKLKKNQYHIIYNSIYELQYIFCQNNNYLSSLSEHSHRKAMFLKWPEIGLSSRFANLIDTDLQF